MGIRLFMVVAFLGVTGWLHGRWTDRWGEPADVGLAAVPLQSIPLSVGDWEGREISREESEIAYRSSNYQIVRRYVNRSTGAAVGLLITCARPSGLIIDHTPKACYTELGYEEPLGGRKMTIGSDDARGEFFAHMFVKITPVSTSRLRLLWSWGDGQNWSFPDRPRITFARKKFLYKMYVTRELLSEDEPIDNDPVLTFLKVLLPVAKATLADVPH